jgi:hypothetical protein
MFTFLHEFASGQRLERIVERRPAADAEGRQKLRDAMPMIGFPQVLSDRRGTTA